MPTDPITKRFPRPGDLVAMGVSGDAAERWAPRLPVLKEWGITTKLRLAHFLTQGLWESNWLRSTEESMSYSAPRLMQVWPGRFPSRGIADQYARNPQKLANFVYADRLGNGPPASNEGWLYRGSGIIQLTGKNNFRGATQEAQNRGILGYDGRPVDYVASPGMVRRDPYHGLVAAGWWWWANKANRWADQGSSSQDVRRVSALVNTGSPNGTPHGLSERNNLFKRVWDALVEANAREARLEEASNQPWRPPMKLHEDFVSPPLIDTSASLLRNDDNR